MFRNFFKKMIHTLRRFGQPLMIALTVLTIISFAWWSPKTSSQTDKSAPVIIVHGKPVSIEVWQREGRVMGVHARLGGIYAMALDPGARFGNISRTGVENSILFEHEADVLGVTATTEEMEEQLSTRLPAFRGQDGKFDPARFDMFAQGVLQPEGFSKAQIEMFLRSEVRLRKVAELLGSLAPATPGEIRQDFLRERLTTEASYVVLKADDFRKAQKVTDEELKQRYEAKKEFLKTDEKRKVRFAAFALPPEAKTPEAKTPDGQPAEDPKRTERLQELANTAYDFAGLLLKPETNFDEAAKAAGATLGETAEFFSMDKGPVEMEGSLKVSEEAFKLTKEKPTSAHVSLKNGTYVLMLKDIQAPEQKPLEQARQQLEAELLNEKTDTAMRARAEEVRTKIAEARRAGKSLYEAAEALGLKPQPFPAFSAMQQPPPSEPYANIVQPAARKLAPGEISDVVVANGAALIVHVDQRPAVDEKGMDEARERIAKMIEGRRMGEAFEAWLAERRQAAGLKESKEL